MDSPETELESWPDITKQEKIQHQILFYSQGPLHGYLTGERARDVFLHSKLPLTVLSKIWNLADVSNDNLLNAGEFVVALHLIHGVLRGLKIPKVLPENLTPKEGAEIPLSAPTSSEKEAYSKVFQTFDISRKGVINGEEAVGIFNVSKLAAEQLADVWDWSDLNRDGQLDIEEWSVACHLLRQLKQGKSLDGVINPYIAVPDRVSPTSLLSRKKRVEDYERHKQRLMQLKEKRKNQILRESRRLELVKEKSLLHQQLISSVKGVDQSLLNEEEITQIQQSDKDSIEKLEEIVARLKKEHEKVRQETVQVILGEQKLQLEHRLLKNETDELNKRLGVQHTKATKDPDPFHQLYEQRKEERKKSNLSEGEEPEVHFPFKFDPFETESLHHSSVSGSHLFLSSHSLNNNNTKHSPEIKSFLSDLHEFGEDFLQKWSSQQSKTSSDMTSLPSGEEEDSVFMMVEVKPEEDRWMGLGWKEDKLKGIQDKNFTELHKKLVDLKTEMQKLNKDSGGQMVFRNPSDYLARKKEKEEEEQKDKSKYPRRSKSTAEKDYVSKRRSYVLERNKDESDTAAHEKRLNRRSLNLDKKTERTRAPDRPTSSPLDSKSHTATSRLNRDKVSSLGKKSDSSEVKTASPPTSPTHHNPSKKTRAPPPPCSPNKESRIPVPSSITPDRPPRKKRPTSPTAEDSADVSSKSSFLFSQERIDKESDIIVETTVVPEATSYELHKPEQSTVVLETTSNELHKVEQSDVLENSRHIEKTEDEPVVTNVQSNLKKEQTNEPNPTVIINTENQSSVSSDTAVEFKSEKPPEKPENTDTIIIDSFDVKLVTLVPDSPKETEDNTVSLTKTALDIPNSDTISLCSIDSLPPALPNTAPPLLSPDYPETTSIGEEAVVTETIPGVQHILPAEPQETTVTEEEIIQVTSIPEVQSSPTTDIPDTIITKEIIEVESVQEVQNSPAAETHHIIVTATALKGEFDNSPKPIKMSTEVENVQPQLNSGSLHVNLIDFNNEAHNESELVANDSDLLKPEVHKNEVDTEDSDLSDIENQNGNFEGSFTPGENKTGSVPLNLLDEDVEDSGEIQLISYSTTLQSPTSQTDSAFEDMMSSMHSNDLDNSNQISLSNTLDDVQDSVITETIEVVTVTKIESEPKVEFTPKHNEPSSNSTHSSYVTEVPFTESKSFVKKAQQFSEIVNQPPKMTIRSTSKEMSDEHLQKVDGERKAVISQSIVKRRGITELSTDVLANNDGESKPTVDVKSSLSLDTSKSNEASSPQKSPVTPINWDEKPAKVDLYSQNIVQEVSTSESVDRESIANLSSTRKQWESILKNSGKAESKPSSKKSTPVKHWEVKLPYKPAATPQGTVPSESEEPPAKPFKMEEDPYANESAIEREIRLANEREEMLRKEQEERSELARRQNASKNQVNTKVFEMKENNNTEFKTMYHEMTEADRGSELQKRETLIKQEIEEQKEREEALTKEQPAVSSQDEESQESLIAREIRQQKEREEEVAKRHSQTKEPKPEPEIQPVEVDTQEMEQPPLTNDKEVTYEEAITSASPNFQHEGESLIAKELREGREREEEIRRMRERITKTDSTPKASPTQTPQPTPTQTSKVTPKQEPVKKSWQPAHSVQTPIISSQTPSRSVTVQPLADTHEEMEESKPVTRKETPIEREIRIARERENELRSQKGLPLLKVETKDPEENIKTRTSVSEEQPEYISYRSKIHSEGGNKTMRQLSSSRLQNEIMKQKEREHKLRDEGKIISTSEDHIGTTKYAEVAGIPKSDGPVKRNFVTRKSVSSLPVTEDSPNSSKTPSENGDLEPSKLSPQVSKEEPVKYKRPVVKSGGASFSYRESRNQAESKIEKELREMREREEELKKSRGGVVSPPTSPRDNNLSSRKAQFEQV